MEKFAVWINGCKTECEAGKNLQEILSANGYAADSYCNGRGVCGKCRIRVLTGGLSDMTEAERKLLTGRDAAMGIRLACMADICGPARIELSEKKRRGRGLTEGYLPDFEKDVSDGGYGLAFDIGTTTVAAGLIDLQTGKEEASAYTLNAQKAFGMDVLTRISYGYDYPESGIERLQEAVVSSMNEVILKLCEKAGINKEIIREIDVSANCIMMHMLLGIDAGTMGRAPYNPAFVAAQTLTAGELGIRAGLDTALYCLPHASAFVGADIVAGMYACEIQKEKGRVLFVDIGTNGEIVLADRGKIISCSCAVGPALEGMNISIGMCAAEGAVEDVKIDEEGVWLTTIGGGVPEGICGSGILSVIKELLRTGIIKPTGVFIQKESLGRNDYRYKMLRVNGTKREFVLSEEPGLLITQRDIRQVQLAKGALLSGIEILLKHAGIEAKDLDRVIIAGQFGAHLSVEALTDTGFLPEAVRDKIVYAGNTSKSGAAMALLSKRAKAEMEKLAEHVSFIDLSETDGYERILAKCMLFPKKY